MKNRNALNLQCPHCGRRKVFAVNDVIPVQKFDVRCCGGQVVTVRVLRVTNACTVREVTWEQANDR